MSRYKFRLEEMFKVQSLMINVSAMKRHGGRFVRSHAENAVPQVRDAEAAKNTPPSSLVPGFSPLPQNHKSVIANRLSPIFVFLFLPFFTSAQEQLTLRQAMEAALENSFEVRLARTEASIATNNATIGNAGMLPEVGLLAGQNNRVEDIRLGFLSGENLERRGAGTEAFNADAQLNWTLFDGLVMFTNLKRLRQMELMGQMQVRLAMENVLHEVVRGYYELVRLEHNIRHAEQALELSQERLRLAEGKLAAGRESKVEVLQARVDRNNDSSRLMQLQQDLTRSRRPQPDLGRQADTQFTVATDTITLNGQADLSKLRNALAGQNPEMAMSRAAQEVALLGLQAVRREKWPVLDAGVGYGFTQSQSEGGFVVSNRTHGLNYGFGTRINLFNGFDRQRRQRNAEAEVEISRLQQERLELELDGELVTVFSDQQHLARLIELEIENVEAASENAILALERYRQGMVSGIELREVQLNRTLAATRLNDLLFQAKVTEAALMRLAGDMRGYLD
jgi:outer membrane protein